MKIQPEIPRNSIHLDLNQKKNLQSDRSGNQISLKMQNISNTVKNTQNVTKFVGFLKCGVPINSLTNHFRRKFKIKKTFEN